MPEHTTPETVTVTDWADPDGRITITRATTIDGYPAAVVDVLPGEWSPDVRLDATGAETAAAALVAATTDPEHDGLFLALGGGGDITVTDTGVPGHVAVTVDTQSAHPVAEQVTIQALRRFCARGLALCAAAEARTAADRGESQ